jgi:hypothetical protein
MGWAGGDVSFVASGSPVFNGTLLSRAINVLSMC